MRKYLIAFAAILATGYLFAATEVKEIAKDWMVTAVSVSTTTVTAIPTSVLSGRYKVVVENADPTFDVSIGTYSAFTYANGFIIHSTTSTFPTQVFPLPSFYPIYCLGQATTVQGTVSVRIIEFK